MLNNRLDYFVSEKFLGKGATRVQQNTIECLGNATFKVQSTHRLKGDEQVDMHLGTCSCAKGIDGSPCVDQSAVVLKYKIQSVNCFPSLSPLAKQEVATLALGSKADADIDFMSHCIKKTMNRLQLQSATKVKASVLLYNE